MYHTNPSASTISHSPESSPLGKSSEYPTHYDPSLLFPIPRAPKRAELQISGTLPFFGVDLWTAYEISWLNLRGKPQIAIATFMVPADSPNIIESKSFKLYLNSFNQERLESAEQLIDKMRTDLSAAAGATVQVTLEGEGESLMLAVLEKFLHDGCVQASRGPEPCWTSVVEHGLQGQLRIAMVNEIHLIFLRIF